MKSTVFRLGAISLLAILLFSIGLHTLADPELTLDKAESVKTNTTTSGQSTHVLSTLLGTDLSHSSVNGNKTHSTTVSEPSKTETAHLSSASDRDTATTFSASSRPGQKPADTTTTKITTTTTASSYKPLPEPAPTPTGKYVVGYYAGWSAYNGYTPAKIPAGQLTHLNYAFAKINPATSRLVLADPSNDRKNFAAIRELKRRYTHLKTLLSVGGWDYSTYFSDIASTAARREAFAQSCLDAILEYGFDGVDLDWEYPVSGGLTDNTNRPQDKQNFTLLLQAIRQKFNAQEKRDGRKYYLTIAGAANTSYLSKIEPQKVAGLVDYIFIMAYDIHGPWDRYADFNAPLYTPSENSPHYKSSVKDALTAYRNSGISVGKMVLGMPLYGYIYQGVSSKNNGLYSSFSSAKSISYDRIRSSYLGKTGYKNLRHDTAQTPYLYGKNTFISYEDSTSISAKTALAKSMGLAGVGVWELAHDTSGSLLRSAYHKLYER